MFVWLIDVDGDLTLFNPTKPFLRGEFGQDQKEDFKKNPRTTTKLAIRSEERRVGKEC